MFTEPLTQLAAAPPVHGGMHDGPPWFVGLIFLLLIAALIGTAIWRLIRGGRCRDRSGIDRAKDFLADRYARGELSTEDYRERLHELGGTP